MGSRRGSSSSSWCGGPAESTQGAAQSLHFRPPASGQKSITSKVSKGSKLKAKASGALIRRGRWKVFRKSQLGSKAMLSLGVKEGPTTLEELLEWPTRHCEDLWSGPSGELMKTRAESVLKCGLILHSDYSGQMCAETGVRMQVQGMIQSGACVQEDHVISWSTCDFQKLCQRVMLNASHKPRHLFGNILDQIPEHDAEHLKSLRPPRYTTKPTSQKEQESRNVEAARAYEQQRKYLMASRMRIFDVGRRAHCLLHGGLCKVAWQQGDIPIKNRPVTWNISGAVCKPWCPGGSRKMLGDPATEAWNVWSIGVASSALDLITLENSDLMPAHIFTDVLSECSPIGKWFLVPLKLSSTESL